MLRYVYFLHMTNCFPDKGNDRQILK